MRADLRNFQSAQEIYYRDGHYVYADDFAALQLTESVGVTIEIAADSAGFAASATHARMAERCAVFVGGPGYAVEPAEEEGVVACDPLQVEPAVGIDTYVGAGLVGGYLLSFGLAFLVLGGMRRHDGRRERV